ncbi:hypothetical protein [Loktanella sp. 3ANDIMAR09]|nr:hypothetical protein [Loktanella sp. 3ANDIMAR09]
MKMTLLLIAAFLAFTIGSFVWYVATWSDPAAASIILPQILPPEASAA